MSASDGYVNYTKPEEPTPITLDKNIQSDRFEGWFIIRNDITGADNGLAAVLGAISNTSWWNDNKSKSKSAGKAKTLLIRVFANTDGGTCSLQFLMKSGLGSNYESNIVNDSFPTESLCGAFTCSGRGYTNINPITGAADSSNSWFECSAFTAGATHNDNRVTEYPTGTSAGGGKFFGIDMLGDTDVLLLSFAALGGSATRIMVAGKVVD